MSLLDESLSGAHLSVAQLSISCILLFNFNRKRKSFRIMIVILFYSFPEWKYEKHTRHEGSTRNLIYPGLLLFHATTEY